MITTLTMNPCIDRTVAVEGFRYGETNRVASTREDPSGKGINVALVLRQLGDAVRCIAPCPEEDGERLAARLEKEGVPLDGVPCPGRLRCNIKLQDTTTGVFTELNEKGAVPDKKSIQSLYDKIKWAAGLSGLLVLSGSLPPGVPADFYRQVLQAVSPLVPAVLDTSGEPLKEGINGRPKIIKPNLEEFSQLNGQRYPSPEAVMKDAKEYNRRGIPVVCVSMGEQGALLAFGGEGFYAPALPLEVRGVQGAGDSLVAGLCHAFIAGKTPAQMLQSGVAAACGSLTRAGTLLCRAEDYNAFLPLVKVYKM